jgi:hypothetical protein
MIQPSEFARSQDLAEVQYSFMKDHDGKPNIARKRSVAFTACDRHYISLDLTGWKWIDDNLYDWP